MRFKRKVLYIDRDDDNCELVKFVFQNACCEVICTDNVYQGLKLASKTDFDAVILEFRQTNMNGVELCRLIRKSNPFLPIVFFTGSAFPFERKAGFAAGANAYLIKPNDFERLTSVVCDLIEKAEQSSVLRNARLFSDSFFLRLQQPLFN